MSNVALGTDGNLHYADDFRDAYVGEYSCPNTACGIRLYLKSKGFEEKEYQRIGPHFSAFPGKPHVAGCVYDMRAPSAKALVDSGFSVEGFFDRLEVGRTTSAAPTSHSSTGKTPKSKKDGAITSVKQLYYYCLGHDDNHELPGGVKVWEVFQDARNKTIASRRRDKRIIALCFRNCNFSRIDTKRGCFNIWCLFPHTETTVPPARYYTLGFQDVNFLMKEVCKALASLKKRQGEVFIIVGGQWQGNHCSIVSKKQIAIF